MTTIATDGKSMAGDGQASSHGTITDRSKTKVSRLANGDIVGCAGTAEHRALFIQWLEGGDRPRIKEPFEALILSSNGSLRYCCEKLLEGNETEAPTAIGSGMDFAIGAMDAGACPEKAVRIASERDPHTGGKIIVLSLT